MQLLLQHIEALIFTSEQPITEEEIVSCLKTVYGWELKKDQLQEVINDLKVKYSDENFAFELLEIADGFQFFTKKEYHTAVNALLQIKARKRLSTAALETLAIIAYKQPLSKSEIEHIRGVNCDYSIQKLLEKELIVIEGKSDGPGKPLLYGTSKNFMDHFGLKSVKELPKLKDLHIADNEIGVPNDLMDDGEIPVDLPPGHLIEHDDMANDGENVTSENQGVEGSLHDEMANEAESIVTEEENIEEDQSLEQHLPSVEPENEQEP
jgi:segregation and condensation protein B